MFIDSSSVGVLQIRASIEEGGLADSWLVRLWTVGGWSSYRRFPSKGFRRGVSEERVQLVLASAWGSCCRG